MVYAHKLFLCLLLWNSQSHCESGNIDVAPDAPIDASLTTEERKTDSSRPTATTENVTTVNQVPADTTDDTKDGDDSAIYGTINSWPPYEEDEKECPEIGDKSLTGPQVRL